MVNRCVDLIHDSSHIEFAVIMQITLFSGGKQHKVEEYEKTF